MSFHEQALLPPDIDRGAQGGPRFATVVIATASGAEQRVVQWSRPRQRWTIGHSLKSNAQMAALVSFFVARRGRAYGFRFFDWLDHDSKIGGLETKHTTEALSGTEFQLVKNYQDAGIAVARRIVKPISDTLGDAAADQATSTVRLYHGASEITSGWTVDCSTGIVSFLSAPGYVPSATFQYHTPVRFDSDEMHVSQDEITYASWPGVDIQELLL